MSPSHGSLDSFVQSVSHQGICISHQGICNVLTQYSISCVKWANMLAKCSQSHSAHAWWNLLSNQKNNCTPNRKTGDCPKVVLRTCNKKEGPKFICFVILVL